MARIPLLDFDGRDIARVFLAKNVAEADRVEALFTEKLIDYAIELEPFLSMFSTVERTGVAFYVAAETAVQCRDLCRESGLKAGVLDEESHQPQEEPQSGPDDNDAPSTPRHGCLGAVLAMSLVAIAAARCIT